MSFTIPLTGNTIVITAAVVTTCSVSVDCTDSAIPTCSGDVCVAMSCGGGSFTPDGAYDSLWDSIQDVLQRHQVGYSAPVQYGTPVDSAPTFQTVTAQSAHQYGIPQEIQYTVAPKIIKKKKGACC